MLLFVEMLPEKMTLFRENNDTRRIIIVPCDMGDEILRYKSFLTVGKKKRYQLNFDFPARFSTISLN